MNYDLKVKILKQYGTQAAFARKCGKNDNWISRIITGRQKPAPDEQEMIDRLLSQPNLKEKCFR